MAKIVNPRRFSELFGLDPAFLAGGGVLDPALNVDTSLFIDPLLLGRSSHPELRAADTRFRTHFTTIIKLLRVSRGETDSPWKAAHRQLVAHELRATCIGYGANTIHGRGFGPKLTEQVLRTAKEIVDLGVRDPDLFALLGLFEDKVGPDRISDLTTNVIAEDLAIFTTRVLAGRSVAPVEEYEVGGGRFRLPRNPLESSSTPILLVPFDVLRELPIAADRNEIAHVVTENARIRRAVNAHVGSIWKASVKKSEIKSAVLGSKDAVTALLDAAHASRASAYDSLTDPKGHHAWLKQLRVVAVRYPLTLVLGAASTPDDVYRVVAEIIEQFRTLIEAKGLARELWAEDRPRPEKSAQRLFFAVADSYCKANNLDITPEADSGAGPVDFKFAGSYQARVLVEVKLSTNGRLVHGYLKQLKAYREAEETDRAVYLVLDVGRMGKKLEQLIKARNASLAEGKRASEVEVINGTVLPSASRR